MARKNKRRRSKSSKAANLARRIIMVANGLEQSKPNSPKFILSKGKLKKLSPEAYAEHEKYYEIDWSRY
jgi:hypothetical protein